MFKFSSVKDDFIQVSCIFASQLSFWLQCQGKTASISQSMISSSSSFTMSLLILKATYYKCFKFDFLFALLISSFKSLKLKSYGELFFDHLKCMLQQQIQITIIKFLHSRGFDPWSLGAMWVGSRCSIR